MSLGNVLNYSWESVSNKKEGYIKSEVSGTAEVLDVLHLKGLGTVLSTLLRKHYFMIELNSIQTCRIIQYKFEFELTF